MAPEQFIAIWPYGIGINSSHTMTTHGVEDFPAEVTSDVYSVHEVLAPTNLLAPTTVLVPPLPMSTALVASTVNMEGEEEDDDLEKMLEESLEEQRETDVAKDINCSDLVMKLSQMCGDPGVSAEASAAFSSLVARLCLGETAEGDDDADVFRIFLNSVCSVLTSALENPFDESSEVAAEPALNITRSTLLRTARFCLVKECLNIEYVPSHTSNNSIPGELCMLLSNETYLDHRMHCYRVAEEMHNNFSEGIKALKDLSGAENAQLIDTINCSKTNIGCSFISTFFSSMCDGQRLRAGNAISARFFGGSRYSYGEEAGGKALCIFNAHGTLVSLKRIQYAFSMLIALSQTMIMVEYEAAASELDIDVRTSRFRARDSPEWKETVSMIEAMKASLLPTSTGTHHRHGPSSFVACASTLADWFERAVYDDVLFGVIRTAFGAPCFTIGKVSSKVRKCWNDYVAESGTDNVCIMAAAQFLCSARVDVHNSCMPLNVAVLCVLAGAIGNMVDPSEINGPFVLCEDAARHANAVNNKLPPVVCKVTSKASDANVKLSNGNGCGYNYIIDALLDNDGHRKQHHKSHLVEARLSACLVMLSTKEALMRDLAGAASASPGEGRKDVRRIHVTSLETLPSLKHSWARHAGDGKSYLVEKVRNPEKSSNAGDLVEKPWRDVNGTSMLITLLFVLAGEAFMSTLEALQGDETIKTPGEGHRVAKTTQTDVCVNRFLDYLILISERYFNTDVLPEMDERVQGRLEAIAVLRQKRAFVRAFVRLSRDTGNMWEGLIQTFSVPVPGDKKKADRDEDARPAKVGRIDPGSPSLTYECSS